MLDRKRKDWINDLISILFIMAVFFFTRTGYSSPIYADEMGYLSNAALMAGLDWSEAVKYLPYYGYGVSLLYVPLFWIFSNVDLVYIGVKVINLLSILVMYVFEKKILLCVFGEEKNVSSMLTAMVCCCTPYLLAGRNFALAEVPLATLYVLAIFFFVKYMDSKNSGYKVALLAIGIYMLMIHLRTIGSFAVIVFMVLCCDYKEEEKKKRLKKWCFTISIAIIGVLVCFWVKGIFVSSGGAGSSSNINDISGQGAKISYLLSRDGFLALCISAFNKLWTFGIAYFLIPFLGIVFAIKSILKNENRMLMLSMILAFGAEFAINCAYISWIDRTDMIFYTRYSEFAILPIFCLGLVEILNNKCKLVTVVGSILLELALTGSIIYARETYETSRHLAACIPDIMFWWKGEDIDYKVAFGVILIVISGLYLLRSEVKYAILGEILAVWMMSCNISYTDYETMMSSKILEGYREVCEYIQAGGYEKVYVVNDNTWEGQHNSCWIQYFLPNTKVKLVDPSAITEIEINERYILLIPEQLGWDDTLGLNCINETEGFYFVE